MWPDEDDELLPACCLPRDSQCWTTAYEAQIVLFLFILCLIVFSDACKLFVQHDALPAKTVGFVGSKLSIIASYLKK